ncbi:PorV/PorQ family protein [bacterium]|nr:PorV/PorQ family protein [bacterium]
MIRRIKLIIIISILMFAMVVGLHAVEGTAGQPGEFLRWGSGARSLAMGRAYTSIAEGGDALLWNPAGLGGVERWELSLMYAPLYVDSRMSYVSFVYPIESIGKFGLSWVMLGMSDFERRDEYNVSLGEFSASQSAINFGYGRWFWHKRFKLGLGTRYILYSLDEDKASGWGGIDFGFMSKPVMRKLTLGMAVQNIGTATIAEDEYPIAFRAGLNYRLLRSLLVSADVDLLSERAIFPRVGLEYRLGRILNLRAGYDGNEVTFGLGLTLTEINLLFTSFDLKGNHTRIDYAGGAMNSVGNNFTRFSLTIAGKEKYGLKELAEITDPCDHLSDYEPLLYKFGAVGAKANLIFGGCMFLHESTGIPLKSKPEFKEAYGYFKEAYLGKYGDNWKNQIVTDEEAKKIFAQHTHYMFAESELHSSDINEEVLQRIIDLNMAGGDSIQYDIRLQYDLAYCYKELGQTDSAKSIFKSISRSEGDNPEKVLALFEMAKLLKEGSTSEKEEAIGFLNQIVDKYQYGFYDDEGNRLSYPMFPKYYDNNIADDALIMLASLKFALGGDSNLKDALANYLKVLLFFPDMDQENIKLALAGAASCYEELGDSAKAQELRTKSDSY